MERRKFIKNSGKWLLGGLLLPSFLDYLLTHSKNIIAEITVNHQSLHGMFDLFQPSEEKIQHYRFTETIKNNKLSGEQDLIVLKNKDVYINVFINATEVKTEAEIPIYAYKNVVALQKGRSYYETSLSKNSAILFKSTVDESVKLNKNQYILDVTDFV